MSLLKALFTIIFLLFTTSITYSQTINAFQSINNLISNEGHFLEVAKLDICANGKFAVSCSEPDELTTNPTIKLWDLATARLLRNLPGVDYALSPDKNTLYLNQIAKNQDLNQTDKTIITLDLISLSEVKTTNYKYRINQISSNANLALSYDTNISAFIFELKSGKKLAQLPGNLLFLSDDFSIALLEINQETKLYDVIKNQYLTTLPSANTCLALCPNGKYVLLNNNNQISLLNLSTRQSIPLDITNSDVWKVSFSKNSKQIGVLSYNFDLRVYNLFGQKVSYIAQLNKPNISINDAEVSLDLDNLQFAICETENFYYCNFNKNYYISSSLAQSYLPAYSRTNPQGNLLICEEFYDEETRKLIAWDLKMGKPLYSSVLEEHQGNISLANLILSDSFIALPTTRGFNIYNLKEDKLILQVTGKSISFTKNSSNLLVLEQGHLVLYSLTTSKPTSFFQHSQLIHSATVNTKFVVGLDVQGSIIVWDIETAKQVFKVDSLSNSIKTFILSDSEKILITVHQTEIKIWSIEENRLNKSIPNNSKKLAAFLSANDKTLLLIDKTSGKAEVWDVEQGLQVSSLGKVVDTNQLDIHISPNGDLAVINGVLWDLKTINTLSNISSGYTTLLATNKVILASNNGYEIWNIKQNSLLATIRNYESNWLVYSPEGFFDGSKESIKLLSWKLAKWPYLQVFDKHLEEQFYTPNLLSKIVR
ncbi:MAG: WD40 repeat domain-containing protein [Blastocatellia bacterium]|nr:WD40 repeat domain-containing protein [Blastocatellia bacterium]